MNSVANILSTMGNETEIEIEPLDGTLLKKGYGILPIDKKELEKSLGEKFSELLRAKKGPHEICTYKAGEIKYGQTKDILFEFENIKEG